MRTKIVSKPFIASVALAILFAIGSTTSHAATVTVALYHLGEADSPAPMIGGNGDATTKDSQGTNDLTRFTPAPTYRSDVGALNSSVSMDFTGGVYRLANSISTATTDLGYEMWAKPLSDTANGFIFMNGDGFDGFGQYIYLDTSGKWNFAKAGIGIFRVRRH